MERAGGGARAVALAEPCCRGRYLQLRHFVPVPRRRVGGRSSRTSALRAGRRHILLHLVRFAAAAAAVAVAVVAAVAAVALAVVVVGTTEKERGRAVGQRRTGGRGDVVVVVVVAVVVVVEFVACGGSWRYRMSWIEQSFGRRVVVAGVVAVGGVVDGNAVGRYYSAVVVVVFTGPFVRFFFFFFADIPTISTISTILTISTIPTIPTIPTILTLSGLPRPPLSILATTSSFASPSTRVLDRMVHTSTEPQKITSSHVVATCRDAVQRIIDAPPAAATPRTALVQFAR
jgi:hypothetical protein